MPRAVFHVNGQCLAVEHDEAKLNEIGSIRVDIHANQRLVPSRNQGGKEASFTVTDKGTAKLAGSTSAVRAGQTLPDRSCSVLRHYSKSTEANKVASARIRYAIKEKLDDMGLLDLDCMGLLQEPPAAAARAGGAGGSAAGGAPPPPCDDARRVKNEASCDLTGGDEGASGWGCAAEGVGVGGVRSGKYNAAQMEADLRQAFGMFI